MRYTWGGCPLYSGVWCPSQRIARFSDLRQTCPDVCLLTQHCRLGQPTSGNSFLTKPHQGFTLVHPSRFSLARSVPLAGHRLRRYPQLRTSPLPVTHVGIGNRLWTLAWVDWFQPFNHSCEATSYRTGHSKLKVTSHPKLPLPTLVICIVQNLLFILMPHQQEGLAYNPSIGAIAAEHSLPFVMRQLCCQL